MLSLMFHTGYICMHLISIAVNNCFCCCCCNVRYFRICMRHQWNHFIVLIFFFIYLYIIILSFELFYYFSLELLSLLSCQKTIIWVLCKILQNMFHTFPSIAKGVRSGRERYSEMLKF